MELGFFHVKLKIRSLCPRHPVRKDRGEARREGRGEDAANKAAVAGRVSARVEAVALVQPRGCRGAKGGVCPHPVFRLSGHPGSGAVVTLKRLVTQPVESAAKTTASVK